MSGVTSGAVITAGLGAVASTVLGQVLGGGKEKSQAAAPPPIAAPTAMPTADSAAVAEARKRSMLEQAARGGRASTILTDTSDKLGG